jgi:hypothetical protein
MRGMRKRFLHDRRETVHALTKIHGPSRDQDLHAARRDEHETAFKTRKTVFRVAASAFGGTRTIAAPMTISIIALPLPAVPPFSPSTTTGANMGGSVRSAAALWRASRRQPNTCRGVAPCRRAICETTAPDANVSCTMRAFCSRDHARRRPAPVITSSRRTAFGSSLSSSVCTSRSPIREAKASRIKPEIGMWDQNGAYETLALARRRSGWLCSRRPRPKPERSRHRAAVHAEAVEEVHESVTRHDHGQAQIPRCSAQGHGPSYRTSPAQGAEQSSGEFSSTDATTRENHEAVRIATAGAEISVDTRSSRQSFPFSPQSTFRPRPSRREFPSFRDRGQDHEHPTRRMTPAALDHRFVARMIPLT